MVGHVIAHVNNENEWIARVVEINGNDLLVNIASDRGGQWQETWNLAHTNAGLQNGEYYIVGKMND